MAPFHGSEAVRATGDSVVGSEDYHRSQLCLLQGGRGRQGGDSEIATVDSAGGLRLSHLTPLGRMLALRTVTVDSAGRTRSSETAAVDSAGGRRLL